MKNSSIKPIFKTSILLALLMLLAIPVISLANNNNEGVKENHEPKHSTIRLDNEFYILPVEYPSGEETDDGSIIAYYTFDIENLTEVETRTFGISLFDFESFSVDTPRADTGEIIVGDNDVTWSGEWEIDNLDVNIYYFVPYEVIDGNKNYHINLGYLWIFDVDSLSEEGTQGSIDNVNSTNVDNTTNGSISIDYTITDNENDFDMRIALYDNNQSLITEQIITESGSYSFEGLSEGTYYVSLEYQVIEDGRWTTFANNENPIEINDNSTTGTITSATPTNVINDTLGSITVDYTIESINVDHDIRIALYDDLGVYLDSESITETGSYSFEGLSEGTYYVSLDYRNNDSVSEEDWTSFYEYESPITISDDSTTGTITSATSTNQSNDTLGSITVDYTIESINVDHDIRIALYDDLGAYLDSESITETGSYSFEGLSEGTYYVSLDYRNNDSVSEEDWTSFDEYESPITISDDSTVGEITSVDTIDINNQNLTGSINVDYTIEKIDPSHEVRIALYDDSGVNLDSEPITTTGSYSFEGLSEGTYYVSLDYRNNDSVSKEDWTSFDNELTTINNESTSTTIEFTENGTTFYVDDPLSDIYTFNLNFEVAGWDGTSSDIYIFTSADDGETWSDSNLVIENDGSYSFVYNYDASEGWEDQEVLVEAIDLNNNILGSWSFSIVEYSSSSIGEYSISSTETTNYSNSDVTIEIDSLTLNSNSSIELQYKNSYDDDWTTINTINEDITIEDNYSIVVSLSYGTWDFRLYNSNDDQEYVDSKSYDLPSETIINTNEISFEVNKIFDDNKIEGETWYIYDLSITSMAHYEELWVVIEDDNGSILYENSYVALGSYLIYFYTDSSDTELTISFYSDEVYNQDTLITTDILTLS